MVWSKNNETIEKKTMKYLVLYRNDGGETKSAIIEADSMAQIPLQLGIADLEDRICSGEKFQYYETEEEIKANCKTSTIEIIEVIPKDET